MHRAAQIDLTVAVSGEIARADQSCGNTRREHLAIPVAVLLVGDEAGVLAGQDAIQAFENSLIGEPVAACGQSILIFAILLVGFRIPRAAADALDQFRADAIALDR